MDFDPHTPITFRQVAVKKIKEELQIMLSEEEFKQLTFHSQDYYRQVALSIQREMFGERFIKKVEVEFFYDRPTTVWQHFKQVYFPKFLLKRFPAKTERIKQLKTFSFERDFVLPEMYSELEKVFGAFQIRDLHKSYYH